MDAPIDSKSNSALPALRRDLEMIPIEREGKTMFVLRDLEGFSDKTVALSPGGMAVASLLDGHNTLVDIQSLFAKMTGAILQPAEVNRFIEQLEKSILLETPEVQAKRLKTFQDFLASPVRKPIHQGLGYPDNPLDLATTLGRFFRDPKGPGKPLPDKPSRPSPPLGLVSPHIDFQRGGPAYAWVYQALAESPPPDVIVALGVAHASPNSPWVMTTKRYETPYGPMNVSTDLYDEIKSCLWYDPREDEWVHRGEHSLEFQALWLKFLWRDKTPPWVPILCSSFERFCPDRSPSTVATVEWAIQKIGEKLSAKAKAGQRIMILAGVDLAHVGPAFGDRIEMNGEMEKRIESEDRGSLEQVMNLDADKFYLSAVADGHRRKICGLSALYTLLRWIKALNGNAVCRGNLLTYDQAPDPRGGLVSFASAIFHSPT